MPVDPAKHEAAAAAIAAQQQQKAASTQASAAAQAAAAAAAAAAEQAKADYDAARQRTQQALQDAYGDEIPEGGIGSLDPSPAMVLVKQQGRVFFTRPISLVPNPQAPAASSADVPQPPAAQ